MISKAIAAIVIFLETKTLNHGAHCSIEDQNALGERIDDIE
jgi:hypothetical protein